MAKEDKDLIEQGSSQETFGISEDQWRSMTESAYGNLEVTRYLYETGLQNVFNDYQKNIANLDSSKQQSLQDAYTIKSLSKKYLGEYASNVGMGDVSGNLLDIYGNYQRNLHEIEQNYTELEIGLNQEYERERFNIMSNILMTDYNISLAQLDEQTQQILFNAINGKTDGLSAFEYIEQYKEIIGESRFRQVYQAVYDQKIEEISTNLSQGFYGYTENEDGEQVRNTDPMEYLRQYKDILTESHYNMLKGALGNQNLTEIALNIAMGNYGDFDNGFDYLDSIRQELTDEEYIGFFTSVRDRVVTDMQMRIESGSYGSRTDEDGNRVDLTLEEYLSNLDDNYHDILGNDLQYSFYRESFNNVYSDQNEILFNAINGNFEGENAFEYLNEQRELGNISPESYREFYSTVYNQKINEISTNLSQGFYGYTENEDGEQVRNTDPIEYLRQYKDILTESDYNMLKGSLGNQNLTEIALDIAMGNYGDFDNGFDYLDSIRQELTDEEYMGFFASVRDRVVTDMQMRLESGSYGSRTDEDGNRVDLTLEEYLSNLDDNYHDILGNDLPYSHTRELFNNVYPDENEILFNAINGNFEGENAFEYLNEQRELGNISPESYYTASVELFSQNEQFIHDSLMSGNYSGFENAEDLINSFDGRISAIGKRHLLMMAGSIQLAQQNSQIDWIDLDVDVDYNLLIVDGKVNFNSVGISLDGAEYYSHTDSFAIDEYYIANENLSDVYARMRNENPDEFGPNATAGDIIIAQATNQRTGAVEDVRYIYINSTWHRLMPSLKLGDNENTDHMGDWVLEGSEGVSGSNFEITPTETNWNFTPTFFDVLTGKETWGLSFELPTFTINGITYGLDSDILGRITNESFNVDETYNDRTKKLVQNLFSSVHDNRARSFVMFEGKMYYLNQKGTIYEMAIVQNPSSDEVDAFSGSSQNWGSGTPGDSGLENTE